MNLSIRTVDRDAARAACTLEVDMEGKKHMKPQTMAEKSVRQTATPRTITP